MGQFNNLAGKKFGRLEVIKFVKFNKQGAALWECKCSCGEMRIVRCTSLTNGNTLSCGCLNREISRRQKFMDLTGQRFGRLLVLKYVRDRRYKNATHTIWLVRCNCGTEKEVLGPSLRSKLTQSCGCLHKELAVKHGKLKAFKDRTIPARTHVLGGYKRGAARRGLAWLLSDEQFKRLIESNCFYCNSVPSNTLRTRSGGELIYNGIDRKNSNLGYISENVLPCCYACNLMKGTMSLEEFLTHIDRIHSNKNDGHEHLCPKGPEA